MDSNYHRSKRRRLQTTYTSDTQAIQYPDVLQNLQSQVAYPFSHAISHHQAVSRAQSRHTVDRSGLQEGPLQVGLEREANSQRAPRNQGNDELNPAWPSKRYLGHGFYEHELAPRECNEIVTSLCPNQPETQHSMCKPEELVCFGMLIDFNGRLENTNPACESLLTPLWLEEDRRLIMPETNILCGYLETRDSELLELFRNEKVEYDILWINSDQALAAGAQMKVWVTIYGREAQSKSLGKLLQDLGFHLQDPMYAMRNAAYTNPQRFGNTQGIRTTDFKMISAGNIQASTTNELLEPTDVLESLTTNLSLMETQGSSYLLTELKSHQKQSLTFMLRRERGWALGCDGGDVWTKCLDFSGRTKYTNNIDMSSHLDQPPPFRGGILADTMGLGKTLSMISLIAHDKMNSTRPKPPSIRVGECDTGSGTLLVLPPSLLHNWEQELSKHLSAEEFDWRRHHGQVRLQDTSGLGSGDIILTTYATLAKEWQMHDGASPLFLHHWHRLVLDEAHEIRDSKSAKAQAVCEIKATCKWAVTGTPTQNRLSDLFSLFHFLNVFPYDDKKTFHKHIIDPWLRGEDAGPEALRKLLGYVMLRRSNDAISLPKRYDYRRYLTFSMQEQQAYDDEKSKTLQCVEDALASNRTQGGYKNALDKINGLRLICELGCVGKLRLSAEVSESTIFRHRSTSTTPDQQPSTPMSMTDDDENFGDSSAIPSAQLKECFPELMVEPPRTQLLSPHNVHQPSAKVYDCILSSTWPTKINALIEDIRRYATSTKSIVFSYRKTILDVAMAALRGTELQCVQIDGTVSSKKRNAIIKNFSAPGGAQVLLLSLGCGATGLTLTAASRAYLLEPQWNPSIEEQALARIHRLGQTQEVTTIRFVMKDSIEQYVLYVQNGKKDLISILLSSKSPNEGQTREKLMHLRQLLK